MWKGLAYHVAAAALLAAAGVWTTAGVREIMPGLIGLRAFGYGSLVLLCVALSIGPLARLWPRLLGRLVPARRAMGIWSAIAAGVHLIYVLEYTNRPLLKLLARPEFNFAAPFMVSGPMGPSHDHIAVVSLFGLAALVVMAVIALVSSDPAQRFLGQSAWKLIQQQAYLAFVLVAGHVLIMQFWGKTKGSPILLRWAPWLLLTVLLLQAAGFAYTVWRRRQAGQRAEHTKS